MKDTTFGHELGQPKIEDIGPINDFKADEDVETATDEQSLRKECIDSAAGIILEDEPDDPDDNIPLDQLVGQFKTEEPIEEEYSSDDDEPLVCFDCNVNFTSKHYLYNHLLHHIRQPSIALRRVDSPSSQAPIKITLKGNGTSFEIISSPQASPKIDLPSETASEAEERADALDDLPSVALDELPSASLVELPSATLEELPNATLEEITDDAVDNMDSDDIATIRFSPNYIHSDPLDLNSDLDESDKTSTTDYNNIPGAEPTPPPEPSPDYPKIRIKSGLLKEPLTITEITDENPNGDFNSSNDYQNIDTYSGQWGSNSLEDPLRISENDSSILSNLFSNNNDRAKDLGFTTSDTEFISLDTNRGSSSSNALQVYNSSQSMVASNPLDTLTNLPMQQLAQQVSRLQPNGSSGMHQQNVLINIQQFPQAPQPQQPHAYQPHMYPPHPPQPMYSHPYQYQPPPNPMYYPQAQPYPQHMPPPQHPRPQMPTQLPPQQHQQQQQQHPPVQQQQQSPQQQPNTQPPQYRPPQPRQQQPMAAPRQPMQQRGGMQPRGMQQMGQRPFNPRQQMAPRQRAPMIRGRGGNVMMPRGPRPRMPMQNGQSQQQQQNGPPRMIKRSPEIMQQLQAKRKKMDVLVPDKHDDADCQVISVQPKNTGLPQIQSIQGNAPEPTDNSIMHLSDSITLSVRNPPPKPPSPKKSDAKDVANILATRGITVTSTGKEKTQKVVTSKSPEPPVAINLNSSVCIIPTAKNNPKEKVTTVDLTDESEPPLAPKPSLPKPQQQPQQQNRVLPFQCDLCPAKYPNSLSLNKHRMSFHKTGTSSSDYGIPLIDLKSTAVVQRLASMGIHNYIPLPGASTDSTFALPIVNMNTFKQGNLSAVGATSVLTLGPIRTIPRPIQNHK